MRTRRRRPDARVGLGFAVAAGAALAALVAVGIAPRTLPSALVPRAGELRPPAVLAAMAGSPSLRPIVVRDGRATLGSGPAGAALEARRPAPPVHLSIPAIGVDAPVDPVGATPTGIAIPAVGRAGWYDAGPRPGEPGRAVVIGHLDAANGPGLFALLPGVENGTRVNVTDARGAVHAFRIVGRAQVEKDKFPTFAVYGTSARPVLVMITCGGPYEGPLAGYRDNVLVYAQAA